jgi:hypothetical protein
VKRGTQRKKEKKRIAQLIKYVARSGYCFTFDSFIYNHFIARGIYNEKIDVSHQKNRDFITNLFDNLAIPNLNMKTNAYDLAEDRVEQWYNNLRSVSSLTESDCYNLKDHLLNTIDELKAAGLDDEEAFEVAMIRLGKDFNFEKEYGRVNSDILLTRKILLILSGIMIYFLFYFCMNTTARMIFFHSGYIVEDTATLKRTILYFLIFYHLFFVILTVFIYINGSRIFNKTRNLKILPLHIVLLVIIVFSLAFTDFKLQNIINEELSTGYLLITNYFSILGYSGYSFSFVMALCFLTIFMRRNRLASKKIIAHGGNVNVESTATETDEQFKKEFGDQLGKFKEMGLAEEEAIAIIRRSIAVSPLSDEKEESDERDTKPMNIILIALSGILVYLLLYYSLHATARIFLTVIQHIENDPEKNFGWVRWYVASFHLVIIFFTTSVYIKDRNLIERLKKLNIKPIKISLIFLTTVFLALADYFLLPIARDSIGHNFELILKFQNIIQFSNLSFSFVILMCFLVCSINTTGEYEGILELPFVVIKESARRLASLRN